LVTLTFYQIPSPLPHPSFPITHARMHTHTPHTHTHTHTRTHTHGTHIDCSIRVTSSDKQFYCCIRVVDCFIIEYLNARKILIAWIYLTCFWKNIPLSVERIYVPSYTNLVKLDSISCKEEILLEAANSIIK